MLRSAFNALTRIHSRPALLKRLGVVDIYSPIRVTPTNYFRFLRGPEYMTIKGKEFVIPVDSILGQFAQTLTFTDVPTTGTYKIQFGSSTTGFLNYNATAANIQTAIRLINGLTNATVTGSYADGFVFTFVGFSASTGTGQIVSSTLDETGTFAQSYTDWTGEIQKGDRIVEGSVSLTIEEIMEMPDIGGTTIGYRCRAE